MPDIKTSIAAGVALVMVAGCETQILGSTPASVTIENVQSSASWIKAYELAAKHCAKSGTVAELSTNTGRLASFRCVVPLSSGARRPGALSPLEPLHDVQTKPL